MAFIQRIKESIAVQYSWGTGKAAIAGKIGVELGNSCLWGFVFYASLFDAKRLSMQHAHKISVASLWDFCIDVKDFRLHFLSFLLKAETSCRYYYISIPSSCRMRFSVLCPPLRKGRLEWSTPDVQKCFVYWKPGDDISTFISSILNLFLILSRKVWLHPRHIHVRVKILLPALCGTITISSWLLSTEHLWFWNLGRCMYWWFFWYFWDVLLHIPASKCLKSSAF